MWGHLKNYTGKPGQSTGKCAGALVRTTRVRRRHLFGLLWITAGATHADSTLIYSTYLGGSGLDRAEAIEIDETGAAYLAGSTTSYNFPVADGFQTQHGGPGNYDIFVTKLSADGSQLIYSTFLGGGLDEFGYELIVDDVGAAYVVGSSKSSNYPTTNAFQGSFPGNNSAIVSKIAPEGTNLVYSTYVGGSGFDYAQGIAVDQSGAAYITGSTRSQNFPVTNAIQSSFNTGTGGDAFVACLTPDGSALTYSTFLGGSTDDEGYDIDVDASGAAYTVGNTTSADYPVTNAYQPTKGQYNNAFISKIAPSGSNLVYSTFLGGSGGDRARAVFVDPTGSAHVVGDTSSTNFPTRSPVQTTLGSAPDAFVASLSPAGTQLLFSTYLGGSDWEQGLAIKRDDNGALYVAGNTWSRDFPLVQPLQPTHAGGSSDAFLARIAHTGMELEWATYLGGTGNDSAEGIGLDNKATIYAVGATYSSNFPTTPDAFQPAFAGGILDAFSATISLNPLSFASATSSHPEAQTNVYLAVTRDFAETNSATVNYSVTGGTATGGGEDYTLAAGTLTFAPGVQTQTITVVIIGDAVNEPHETIDIALSDPTNALLGTPSVHTHTILSVNTAPVVDPGVDQIVSVSDGAFLDGSVQDDGQPAPPGVTTTLWTQVNGPGTATFADASSIDTTASFSTNGTYILRLSAYDGALSSSAEVTITVLPPTAAAPIITPEGGTFEDAVQVVLSSADTNATIYYTVDGSTPDGTSTIYEAPFTVTNQTMVHAFASSPGHLGSAVTNALFTRIYPNLVNPPTNIPWERVLDAAVGGRPVSGAFSGGLSLSAPALCDIDDDGDLDLFIGNNNLNQTGLIFYENVGTPRRAQWAEPNLNYAGLDLYNNSAPVFVDIDSDGDLDLFVGYSQGIVRFYTNVGTAKKAAWILTDQTYNNIDAVHPAMPAFGDIDGDNDLDLLVGGGDGVLNFYENTGTVHQAQWAAVVSNYNGIALHEAAPTFADIDDDGDLDLFVGSFSANTIYYYENTGTVQHARWAPVDLNYANLTTANRSKPIFADLDADGDLDFLVGDTGASLTFLDNEGSSTNAIWGSPLLDYSQMDVGGASVPDLVDIDNDGDQDLIVGDGAGYIYTFENLGSPTTPFWSDQQALPIPRINDSWASPALTDIDGDGDHDLFVGTAQGFLYFYRNTGSPETAMWAPPDTSYNDIDVGLSATPTFADIDADGDQDLFVGEHNGSFDFYENTGDVALAAWAPPVIGYADINVGQRAAPRFEDIDQDGDLDLFLGAIEWKTGRAMTFFENVGTTTTPIWGDPVRAFAGTGPISYSKPTFGDLDGDGDADLLIGEADGGIHFYRNGNTKLTVEPPTLTLIAGQTNRFVTEETAGNPTWSFVTNRSTGVLHPLDGTYTAGAQAPAIDVIQATSSNGAYGRVHVNVIRPEDTAAIGKAIIIAGGKSGDDPVWRATDLLADKAYNTLQQRAFSKETIHYLSFDPDQDVDGNGLLDDIDGGADLAQATTAFTTFAQGADRLFVYLVDHGSDAAGQGSMRLNGSELLTAAQLNSWLDSLQAARPSMAITLVLDFCYAGSFLDELAVSSPTNRTVVSATTDQELTYFIAGGLVSFSDAFLTALHMGYNFYNAFLIARGAMSTYQTAQLDDNGDGHFESGVDGTYTTNQLGFSFLAGLDIPQIGNITPNHTTTNGVVTLSAETVSSVYPLEKVWCVIVPPSHQPNTNQGLPVIDLPEVELQPSSTTPGRYENTFSGFTEPGLYKVVFVARDIWGSLSVPKQSYINQSTFIERTILLAGEADTQTTQSNIQFIAAHAYKTFQARLFDHDSIYLLHATTNHDFDGDGTNDVDTLCGLAALSNAISTWAATADRLNLYLIGEGTNDTVRLNASETLTATELDIWLDAFQTNGAAVTLMLEFNGSGGFATNMTPPAGMERITVASTRAQRQSLMTEGGLVSFSQYFLSEIFAGKTIGQAATQARKSIRRASGLLRQRAGIDDDGDGVLNEKNVDGQVAQTRYIGAAFVTGDDTPTIGSTLPPTALTNGTQLTIWADDVTDADGISNVWCVITPPAYDGGSPLPRVDLLYQAGSDRYEAPVTTFTQPGAYVLTFYASDNNGHVSLATQSYVIKPDQYEVNDTMQQANRFDGSAYQVHTFHDDTDVDFVRFFAISNYAYDIETFHISTNIDTVIDIYYQETNGALTHIDHLDDFGFDEGELTGLDFPATGFYFARISQFAANGSGPGAYELIIDIPAGDGLFLVLGYNELNAQPLPTGSFARVNGAIHPFANGVSVPLILPGGAYTVEVVCADAAYLPISDPQMPGQVANPLNIYYGNPRTKTIEQVVEGETAGYVAFGFMPYVDVRAELRDPLTQAFIEQAEIRFESDDGFYSISNGYTFDGDPFYTDYKTNWKSTSDGTFPLGLRIPAVDARLQITAAGYSNRVVEEAVVDVSPGDLVDLGTLYVHPIDANGNGFADAWETSYFGDGADVVGSDDFDADGHMNHEEYLLGTDPTAIADGLAVAYTFTGHPPHTLTWTVQPGRTYRAVYKEDLHTTGWSAGGGPWEATPGVSYMQWTDSAVPATGIRCYRIEVLIPHP